MITLLHGENTLASRQELEKMKKVKNQEVIVFEGTKVNLEELIPALFAKSLFGQEKLVILENFFSKRKGLPKNQFFLYLNALPPSVNLIFWEEREISPKVFLSFPQAQRKLFRLYPVLFKFLESLRPGNGEVMITLLRQALSVEEPEMVFYMLVRQFRLLLGLLGNLEKIEEVGRLTVWQKEKLLRQGRYFSQERLLKVYRDLLEIDLRQKLGRTPFSRQKNLELFLATL